MNSHVIRYFRKYSEEDIPLHLFHDVIPLHETADVDWTQLSKMTPHLPKGWIELSRLKTEDRIEFTREFWLKTIPYEAKAYEFFQKFFSRLDDVGVFVTQAFFDSPYECEFVYSLRNESCFFHGRPPSSEDEVDQVITDYKGMLPEDFLTFLYIHDGFSKNNDAGMIPVRSIQFHFQKIVDSVKNQNRPILCGGQVVDPSDLIPFYDSYGRGNYQCFYANWDTGQGSGNVYYSKIEHAISNYLDKDHAQENLAFSTFLEWLMFYLETIES